MSQPPPAVGKRRGGRKTALMTALRSSAAQQQRDDGADQEDEEENLGDAGSAGRNAEKTERRGNQRNDEEYGRIIKHDPSLSDLTPA